MVAFGRVLVLLFLVVASHDQAFAAAAAPATAAINAAIAHPERSADDRERDARSDIAKLLAFVDARPGLWAADIFGGGGYFTELLARVAGDEGRIYLQNPAGFRQFSADEEAKRLAIGRLPNVVRLDTEPNALGLPENALDLVIIVMGYHDLYYVNAEHGWPQVDVNVFFGQIHRALKDTGKLVVIDHAAVPGSGNSAAQSLHRIDEEFARHDIEAKGFKLDGSFAGLRNPSDPHTVLVFDKSIRGKTDLFVQRYSKQPLPAPPAEPVAP